MEYDGILRFGKGQICADCVHGGEEYNNCQRCSEEMTDKYGLGPEFANADQLKGLIEEAEAGAQAWVRDNTMFVCEDKQCNRVCGERTPHNFRKECCDTNCADSDIGKAMCKPFRGTKGEPQKFSGIDKRVIESLIEECDAEAKQPSGDFTKLESFTATVQGIKAKPTAEDCSEVEALPEWADDGYGCLSCKFLSTEKSCLNAQRSECGVDTGYCMYERIEYRPNLDAEAKATKAGSYCSMDRCHPMCSKTCGEDRSDLEYNKNKEYLRGEEVISSGGITIVINDDDLSSLSDIKVTAEVQEDDVEYVVLKHFDIFILCKTDIDPCLFKKIVSHCNIDGCASVGKTGAFKHWPDGTIPELVRLGFIEAKVCDYPANAGDYFAYKNTVWAVLPINGYLHLLGIKGAMLGEQTGLAILPNGNRMLSDHVRKDRLSEFKPCTVEIREVD